MVLKFLKSNLKTKLIIQTALALLILAAGALISYLLIESRKPPEKVPVVKIVPLVEAVEVFSRDVQIIVKGYGTVSANTEAQVVSQVAGKVLHHSLIKGRFFKADEELVKIDPRDYELELKKAQAQIESAKVVLEQEQAEALVAKAEWYEMHPNEEPDSPLVFREPQVNEAKANLLSAQANLEKAMLDLERTTISLPFDGRVLEENIDIGQFVNVGESFARAYAIDVIEVNVPLEDSELRWFRVGDDGSEAQVFLSFAGEPLKWTGKVVRTAGEIDPKSRMVHVIIEIEDPYAEIDNRFGLTPGMFVSVEIQGETLNTAIVIPRSAVHNRDEVWVVENKHLKITKVKIARSDRDFSYVIDGLSDRAIVITSSIDAVVDGMEVDVELK